MKALIATDGTAHAVEAAHEAVRLLHPDIKYEIIRVIPETEDPNETAGGFEGPLITEEEAAERRHRDEEQAQIDLASTLAATGETATISVVGGNDAGRQTQLGSPSVIVTRVDGAVAVSIGGQTPACLVERVPPHHVVGRIDDAVGVIVGQWQWS